MLTKIISLAAGATCALAFGTFAALADGEPKAHHQEYAHGCDNSGRFGGAYIGLHAGTAALTSTVTDRDYFDSGADLSHTKDGWLAGVQGGYNWQKCNVVFGIEADFSYTSLDSKRDYDFGYMNFNRTTDWLASIRTKSGVVVGNLFLYATGGIAFMDTSLSVDAGNYYNQLSGKLHDGVRVGWVAGLGTEYAVNERISITSDVLYYGFGSESGTATQTNNYYNYYRNTYRFDDTQSMWVARMGVNFKLGARETVYEPLK